MEIHITNINGITKDAPLRRWQNYMASIGRELGFLEMGIYIYPSSQEEDRLLSVRLDGIIASVEPGDLIFLQLPTGNGEWFEKNLILKLKSYRDTRVVGILRDEEDYLGKTGLLNMLDGIWVPYQKSLSQLQKNGLSVQRTWVSYFDATWDKWHIRKQMLEIVDFFRAEKSSSQVLVSEDEIQAAFCVTDRTGSYTEFVGIAMQSIVDHTKSRICFHVIHDGTIQPLHRQYLSAIAANSGNRLVFHQVDPENFRTENDHVKNFSIASLFRLAIPDILADLQKVIYLDADLLFSIDISELWETSLSGCSLAAVPDYGVNQSLYTAFIVSNGSVPREQYFNSGLLVMDIARIRKKHNLMKEGLTFISENAESGLPDQDALNAIFLGDTLLLDGKWNFNCNMERIFQISPPEDTVYHFMGAGHVNQEHMTKNDRYALEVDFETPWQGCFSKKEMYSGFAALSYKVDQLQKLLSQICDPDCKKIYCGGNSPAMNHLLELVPPGEKDYFVRLGKQAERGGVPYRDFSNLLAEDPDSCAILFDLAADEDNRYQKLQDAGYKQGENLFAVQALLFATQGGFRL